MFARVTPFFVTFFWAWESAAHVPIEHVPTTSIAIIIVVKMTHGLWCVMLKFHVWLGLATEEGYCAKRVTIASCLASEMLGSASPLIVARSDLVAVARFASALA